MEYNELSTKKLRALLETTTPEGRAIIAEILKSRAEGEKTASNEATGSAVRPLPLTNDELRAKADELRAKYKGTPCQVITLKNPTWIDGVITSVMEGRNSGTIFFSVRTSDNQRIIKTYNSPDLKLSETATVSKRTYNKVNSEEWDPEKAIEQATQRVGCLVSCVGAFPEGAPGTLSMGRVVAVIPNKRNRSILLRLHVPSDPTDKKKYKEIHRAISDNMCFISDEQTEGIRQVYMDRVKARKERAAMDPDKRVQVCMENLRKAEASLERAKEILRLRQEQLSDAKNELLKTL